VVAEQKKEIVDDEVSEAPTRDKKMGSWCVCHEPCNAMTNKREIR